MSSRVKFQGFTISINTIRFYLPNYRDKSQKTQYSEFLKKEGDYFDKSKSSVKR